MITEKIDILFIYLDFVDDKNCYHKSRIIFVLSYYGIRSRARNFLLMKNVKHI